MTPACPPTPTPPTRRRLRPPAGLAAGLLAAALVVAAAALAAPEEDPERPDPAAHPLAGSAWRAEHIDGEPTLDHEASSLAFVSEERVAGSGACNPYSGPVTLGEADALHFGPLASTRKACPPPVMEQERRFFAALEAARRAVQAESELRLLDAEGRVRVRLRRIGVPSETVPVGEATSPHPPANP